MCYFHMHRSKILCFNLRIISFFHSLRNPLIWHRIVECKEHAGIGNKGVFSATLTEFYCYSELKGLEEALMPAQLLCGAIGKGWPQPAKGEVHSVTEWGSQCSAGTTGTPTRAGGSTHGRICSSLLQSGGELAVQCKRILRCRTAAVYSGIFLLGGFFDGFMGLIFFTPKQLLQPHQ